MSPKYVASLTPSLNPVLLYMVTGCNREDLGRVALSYLLHWGMRKSDIVTKNNLH